VAGGHDWPSAVGIGQVNDFQVQCRLPRRQQWQRIGTPIAQISRLNTPAYCAPPNAWHPASRQTARGSGRYGSPTFTARLLPSLHLGGLSRRYPMLCPRVTRCMCQGSYRSPARSA
jgi:hypothetical protein